MQQTTAATPAPAKAPNADDETPSQLQRLVDSTFAQLSAVASDTFDQLTLHPPPVITTASKDLARTAVQHVETRVHSQELMDYYDQSARLSQEARAGPVNLMQKLNSEQSLHLDALFPNIKYTTINARETNDHILCRAIRTMFLHDAIRHFCIGDVRTHNKNGCDVLLKDAGGNPMHLASLGIVDSHVCAPVLSSADGTRQVDALRNLEHLAATGDLSQSTRANDILTGNEKAICHNAAEYCNVTSRYVLLCHSPYDMGLESIVGLMVSSRAESAYGILIFDPIVLYKKRGRIECIGCDFRRVKKRGVMHIEFSFEDDAQYGYSHRLDTYLALIHNFAVRSVQTGDLYLISPRRLAAGHLIFSIDRALSSIPASMPFKVFDLDLRGSLVLKVPELKTGCSSAADVTYHIVVVPSLLFERVYAYALQLGDGKFKLKAVFMSAYCFNTRYITNGIHVDTGHNVSAEVLHDLSLVVYMLVYVKNYESTKLLSVFAADQDRVRQNNAPEVSDRCTSILNSISSYLVSFFRSSVIPEATIEQHDELDDIVRTVQEDADQYSALLSCAQSVIDTLTGGPLIKPVVYSPSTKLIITSELQDVLIPAVTRVNSTFSLASAPPQKSSPVAGVRINVLSSCSHRRGPVPTVGDGNCLLHSLIDSGYTNETVDELRKFLAEDPLLSDAARTEARLGIGAQTPLPLAAWLTTEHLESLVRKVGRGVCVHTNDGALRYDPDQMTSQERVHVHYARNHFSRTELITGLTGYAINATDDTMTFMIGTRDPVQKRYDDLAHVDKKHFTHIRNETHPLAKLSTGLYPARSFFKLAELVDAGALQLPVTRMLDISGGPGSFALFALNFSSCEVYGTTGPIDYVNNVTDDTRFHYLCDSPRDLLVDEEAQDVVDALAPHAAAFPLVVADGYIQKSEYDNDLLKRAELRLAVFALTPDGVFLQKLVDPHSTTTREYVQLLASHFASVVLYRVASSYHCSREFFVVCTSMRAPDSDITDAVDVAVALKQYSDFLDCYDEPRKSFASIVEKLPLGATMTQVKRITQNCRVFDETLVTALQGYSSLHLRAGAVTDVQPPVAPNVTDDNVKLPPSHLDIRRALGLLASGAGISAYYLYRIYKVYDYVIPFRAFCLAPDKSIHRCHALVDVRRDMANFVPRKIVGTGGYISAIYNRGFETFMNAFTQKEKAVKYTIDIYSRSHGWTLPAFITDYRYYMWRYRKIRHYTLPRAPTYTRRDVVGFAVGATLVTIAVAAFVRHYYRARLAPISTKNAKKLPALKTNLPTSATLRADAKVYHQAASQPTVAPAVASAPANVTTTAPTTAAMSDSTSTAVKKITPSHTPANFEAVDVLDDYAAYVDASIKDLTDNLRRMFEAKTDDPKTLFDQTPGAYSVYEGGKLVYGHAPSADPVVVYTANGLVKFSAGVTDRYVVSEKCVSFIETDIAATLKNQRQNVIDDKTWRDEITIAQGPPGCGKTTTIVTTAKRLSREHVAWLIVTTSKANRDNIITRLGSATNVPVFTVGALLINGSPIVDYVLFDEALTAHPAVPIVIHAMTGAREVQLFGDVKQIPFLNRLGYSIVLLFPEASTVFKIRSVLELSFRSPADVAARLAMKYKEVANALGMTNRGMISRTAGEPKNTCTLMKYKDIGAIPKKANTVYLAFTQSAKQELIAKGFTDVYTIHEFQGGDAENVIVVRTDTVATSPLYLSEQHALVALSRHTRSLLYVTPVDTDALAKLILDVPSMAAIRAHHDAVKPRVQGATPTLSAAAGDSSDQDDSATTQSKGRHARRNAAAKAATASGTQQLISQQAKIGGILDTDFVPRSRNAAGDYNLVDHFGFQPGTAVTRAQIAEAISDFVANNDLRRSITIDVSAFKNRPYRQLEFSQEMYSIVRDRGVRVDYVGVVSGTSAHPIVTKLMNVDAIVELPNTIDDVVTDTPVFESVDARFSDVPASGVPNVVSMQTLALERFGADAITNTALDTYQIHVNPLEVYAKAHVGSFGRGLYEHPYYDKFEPLLQLPVTAPRPLTFRENFLAADKRNFCVPELATDVSIVRVAREMYDSFITAYFCHDFDSLVFEPIAVTSEGIMQWVAKQPPGTLDAVEVDRPFTDEELNSYDFMIKRVAKPCLERDAAAKYTALQTIVCHNKRINAIFCVIFAEFKRRVFALLRDNVHIHSEASTDELADIVTAQFPPHLADGLNTLECDVSKYDKSQGAIALEFECIVLRAFGVPDHYVRLWYIAHECTRVRDKNCGLSFKTLYQRKSGDASTYIGNTLYILAILSHSLRNVDVVYTMASGDDSLVFYRGERFKVDVVAYALTYNIECKFFDYASRYFCSKFLVAVDNRWVFAPDPLKVVMKLARRDIANVEHLEQYRISVRDNLSVYRDMRVILAVAPAAAERYDLSYVPYDVLTTLGDIAHDIPLFSTLFSSSPDAKYVPFSGLNYSFRD